MTRAFNLEADSKRARELAAHVETMTNTAESHLARVTDDLKPEIAAERRKKIISTLTQEAAPLVRELEEIARAALEHAKGLTVPVYRRYVKFSHDPTENATQGLYWQQRLAKVGTANLLQFAEDAKRTANAALAEAIREELASRGGDVPSEEKRKIAKVLDGTQLPPAIESARIGAVEMIQGAREAYETAQIRFRQLADPQGVTSAERISAHRRAIADPTTGDDTVPKARIGSTDDSETPGDRLRDHRKEHHSEAPRESHGLPGTSVVVDTADTPNEAA